MIIQSFTPDRTFQSISWNGQVSTVFEKKIDNVVFQSDSIEKLEQRIHEHSKVENLGAVYDYGKGKFNGD